MASNAVWQLVMKFLRPIIVQFAVSYKTPRCCVDCSLFVMPPYSFRLSCNYVHSAHAWDWWSQSDWATHRPWIIDYQPIIVYHASVHLSWLTLSSYTLFTAAVHSVWAVTRHAMTLRSKGQAASVCLHVDRTAEICVSHTHMIDSCQSRGLTAVMCVLKWQIHYKHCRSDCCVSWWDRQTYSVYWQTC